MKPAISEIVRGRPFAEHVLECLADRRSCRVFAPRPVDREVLEAILKDGVSAPCASNTQNWHFVVVTDPGLRHRVQEIAGGNPHLATCGAIIFLCFQKGWSHDKFAIVQSVAAACYHMMLSAHLRGLATVWNAGIGNPDRVAELLGVPAIFEIQGALAVGYAADDAPLIKAPRRPAGEVWSWNGFHRPEHSLYPVRGGPPFPFRRMGRARNPYAEWNPAKWGWERIADFRSYLVWAKSPTPGIYMSRRQRELLAMQVAMLPDLGDDAHLVDLLPWGGTSTIELRRRFGPRPHLHIAELASSNIDFINQRLLNEGLAASSTSGVMGASRLPYDDASIDAVFSGESLEHVPDPVGILREIRRVLKPGGHAVIAFRNSWSMFGLRYYSMLSRGQVPNQGPYRPLPAPLFIREIGRYFSIKSTAGMTPGKGRMSRCRTGIGSRLSEVVVCRVTKDT